MARPQASIRILELTVWLGLGVALIGLVLSLYAVFSESRTNTRYVSVNPYATATTADDPAPTPTGPPGTVSLVEPAFHATLTIAKPSPWQSFLLILPELLLMLVLCAVAVFLLLLLRSFREGDPFTPKNARRLSAIGILLLCVAAIPGVDQWILQALVSGTPLQGAALHAAEDYNWAWIVGFGVLALAEFFRQGSRLRHDVQGLV
ncbi:DUF2975 domain-containing protein [Nonomuraea turkmeniaca]|uniref:DUF2975 domain-containing protein n=1 Tax=Nonomuraea turkmeniaca TaxID=103838 RepID=A0A5S4FJJ0_9ACTN|nr:DUF2975 domain-containing protein [Nonomuraea turkmeniaca]TMR20759.1 DUF2975 domain-containing protein [Nonomuraea turkmeniaca]